MNLLAIAQNIADQLQPLELALGRKPVVILTARFGASGSQKRLEATLQSSGFPVVREFTKKVECVIVGLVGDDQGFIRGVKTRSMERAESGGIPCFYVPSSLLGVENRPAA